METQVHRILFKGRYEVNEIKRNHFSNVAFSAALKRGKKLLLHYLERFKQPYFRITHEASDYVAGFNASLCIMYYLSHIDKCGCVILDFALKFPCLVEYTVQTGSQYSS